jgi:glycosyltransferase involved in cell wall biosynthesis
LLVSAWPDAPLRTLLDGMEVHRTGGRHTFPIAARLYYHKLAPRSFDLVVEDLNKVPLFTPLWAGRPVVLLVHHLFGRTAFGEASPPIAAATWLLERPLARIYRDSPVEAVSQSTAEDLVARGFDSQRIKVIPNGINLERYAPDPDGRRFDEPTVLYLGRLKRYKRVDLVLHAIARLARQGIQARLIIAGQGDREDELRALRDQLGLSRLVEMPGFVSEAEKRRLMQQAWVHVLTSPKEGWGITNLEAAACGTPTVASNSPGLRDSVIDGKTGLLVPHGEVEPLAAALGRVLTDAELRNRLGKGAREFAQRFSWDRSADETEAHLAAAFDAVPGLSRPRPGPPSFPDRTRSITRRS